MEERANVQPVTRSNGIGYCIGGLVSFFIGLFVLGIVFGPLTIWLGEAGAKSGSKVFGAIVKTAGCIETLVVVAAFYYLWK